ncbi:MAG: hypothetical protein COW00_15435 [Bdellovibrio sp. CG12_big_fil_rev_8_21_14_0_65_39_13]|nr:MAG: hypothetical protein COW78_07560 [Bdellovibrio sp. CG22_combo_CG10-13_8_21_14_all_39_27]PIQ58511.1 MAG: hypothetical protein COW00_15435 [Bdellovibrio sp. CG12_big_fil_rev_8_21_14_0_65_39_13]PIR35463.1 MAG: hypothetical protein COV37_08255 [Bdellovibrio sp. CG11_big_fil_rev_8_21_14_0_20_39_38]
MNITITDLNLLTAFWLVFSRWLSILIQLPLFEHVNIPPLVKVLTALIISYGFFPGVSNEVMKDVILFNDSFWVLTIFYTLSGLLIGYLVRSIMSIFTASGSIITQQIGFGAIRYFDPMSAEQVGPFEQIIQWTMLIIVIGSGALIPMFKGVHLSFATVNLHSLKDFSTITPFFLDMFKGLFMSSLLLATPLIFINMLIMTVLGIISKAVPQMNIIMVSFVLNIGLGLLIFSASSSEFFYVAFQKYTDHLGRWFQYII